MLDKLWLILIILLVISGIKGSILIKFKNYKIFSSIKKLNYTSLFISLGTKMGVGTIIGTTMSIIIGGPGTLLWMFIFTLLTSSLIYIESYLGNKYKEKTKNGYIGGIYYYTKNGLNKNMLAKLTLILFIITYSIFFLMIQANTITNILNTNKIILTIVIIGLLILLLNNNISELTKILTKIIPVISILFIIISLYAISKHINEIPIIISNIIKNAFNKKALLTGMIIGIKRSIFLNELLIGTASMASGTTNENINNIASSLTIGTYFVTYVISSLIALIILTYKGPLDYNYNNYLLKVFTYHFGNYGHYFLGIIVSLLGTSSIISGIYIGLSNLEHLTNKKITTIFKILLIITITTGIYLKSDKIWLFTDIFMLILIFLNNIIINKLKDKMMDS